MSSLAVKYRPTDFKTVCSQTSIIKILNKQLEVNDIKNTYLFCGSSGCGKTTVARIFSNMINKGVGEPIEIDGASNNGVDNVKSIINSANERSLSSEYKIYIIDECHALTSQAWQAFLKCIEEPPKYTIFIFCTTDPQKIPATILNRCMRFNFNRISADVICDRLKFISKSENYTNYDEACEYISKISGGQMRDAIALLEKSAAYNKDLSINNVLEALGNFSYKLYFDLIRSILLKDEKNILGIINYTYNQGTDLKVFVSQFLDFCLDVNKYILFKDISLVKIPSNMTNDLNEISNIQDACKFYGTLINKVLNLKNSIKNDLDCKTTIEVVMLDIVRGVINGN